MENESPPVKQQDESIMAGGEEEWPLEETASGKGGRRGKGNLTAGEIRKGWAV
jgi:hypothetical protein